MRQRSKTPVYSVYSLVLLVTTLLLVQFYSLISKLVFLGMLIIKSHFLKFLTVQNI